MAGVKGRSGRRKKPDVKSATLPNAGGFLLLPEVDQCNMQYYDLFLARCNSMGIIEHTDEVAFNALVVTFGEWLESYREVKKRGKYEIDIKTGASRVSAMFRVERKLFADLIALCREFGFTPSSRASLVGLMTKEEPQKVGSVSRFISSDPGDPL